MGFSWDLLRFGSLLQVTVFAGWAAVAPVRGTNSALHLPLDPIFEGFALRPLFPGIVFDNPVAVTAPPGETNRLFIVERTGRIMVVTNLAAPDKTVFLDLSTRVHAEYLESGLLGLAFHPGYATNRSFFTFRTRVSTTLGITNVFHDELSRFEAAPNDPNRANPGSETRVWAEYDETVEHNAGDIQFGPDGYLYVSLGNGPDPEKWAADRQPIDQGFFEGIMRIDVDRRPGNLPPNPHPGITDQYLVPHDNPFVGVTNHGDVAVEPARVRTEYYAIGLRNPWRMSFDAATGLLYCGDVGAGQVEEIDLIERGGNYGWPYREGTNVTELNRVAPTTFRPSAPLHVYLHGRGTNQGSAVIGGVVYRGAATPDLQGAYIFGDNPSGHIWALRHDGAVLRSVQRLVSEPGIAAFATDPRNGDVLVVNHASGIIKRLTWVSAGGGSPFPETLAATGLFTDLSTLSPAPGVQPYSVNVPFWSDNAVKSRWFSVPDNQFIMFAAESPWLFPAGMVWVKHFDLPLGDNPPGSTRRIETRVLVKNAEGVYGVTYRWGDSRTDAGLVPEIGLQESLVISEGGTIRTQAWHYPARYECLSCHTPSAGYALGFGTAQLNRSCENAGCSENQIRALGAQGYFSGPVPDVAGLRALANATNTHYPLEYRVRSYWAANCSQCHNPGGVEGVQWDARITTPLNEARVLDVFPVFNLGAIGTLDNGVVVVGTGSPENRIIKPNRPTNSVLLTRLSTPIGVRMPPLGSTILDHRSIHLVSNWIQTLPSFPWDHHNLAGSGFEGSASISGGIFTVAGSRRDLEMEGGLDVIPILDLGHYLHRRLGASGRVTARVAAARSEAESSSGLAGLMVREDLSEFSPGAAVWLAPDGRAKFERRTDWGAVAVAGSLSDTAGFSWIRLSREADRIRGLASSDGSHWVLIGEDKLVLSAQARMGFSAVALPPATFFEAVLEDVSVLHIAITNPAPHALFVQPTTVPLKAHLEALGSSVERVEFHSGTNQLGHAEHPPYLLQWTNAPVGAHSIVARAIDADGTSIDSLPVPIVVSGPTPGALLLTSNATTKGVWKNVFGRDGTIIVGDSTNLPSYAAVEVGGARTVVWSPATVDGRALERVRGLLRVAAAWEADREFSIDLNLVDGRLHRLGLYFLDWNANFSSLRSQAIEVTDATRGIVLDRQTLPDSSGGIYLVWQLRGHVRIRVVSENSRTAVLSGLFLDASDNHAPVVRLVSPSPGAIYRLPVSLPLVADATDSDGTIARVEFLMDDIAIGETLTDPHQIIWGNMLAGRHTLRARAIDDLAEPAVSEPIEVTIESARPEAEFVRVDSTTSGRWKGRYGRDGYLIVNHATNLPVYATIVPTNMYDFTAVESSQRPVALRHVGDDSGIEAGWFPGNQSSEFTVAVPLLDDARHRVSFYVMDFDTPARIERIEMVGADGEILDTREVSFFTQGKYLTWAVRGPVVARFKSVRGNCTLSGIFLDPDLTPFQTWLALHFSDDERASPDTSGPMADPDGDGLDNRTEYILGLNPRLSDGQSRPSLHLIDGYVTFTYTRAKAVSDASLFIEWSDDLLHWSDVAPVFETISSIDEGEVERITLRCRAPSSVQPVGFLRTRVSGLETE